MYLPSSLKLRIFYMMLLALVASCTGSPTVAPTPSAVAPQPRPAGMATPRSPEKSAATKTLETKLQRAIAKTSGIPVQTITCPNQIPVQATARFNCQATAEGQTFIIAINAKEDQPRNLPSKVDQPKNEPPSPAAPTIDKNELQFQASKRSFQIKKPAAPTLDKNELQWSTQGLLVIPKLEQTIQRGIKEQFNVVVKTSCGGKVRAAKQGDQFQCKITDTRGQARVVNVRVDDAKGNVTWKL